MFKKVANLRFILLFLLCISLCVSFYVIPKNIKTNNIYLYTVVIDAGHGGLDGGVTGITTNVCESEINLSIAKKLKQIFENSSIKVVMTRHTSGGLYGGITSGFKKRDMQKRGEIIKNSNADLMISIHQNKFSLPSRRGAQVFYKLNSPSSQTFANKIQNQLNQMPQASRQCFILPGDYFVLNVALCPAVIVECGFLSNAQDEKLLISDEYQSQIAYTIFKGCVDFLSK